MSRPEASFDRPLPTSLDAERLVLGAAMSDAEAFPQISALLEASDFSLEKHVRIYRRMFDLFEAGKPLSYVSVAEELRKQGQLESVDGLSYLVSLDGLPTLHNLQHLCEIVRGKGLLRRTIVAANDLIDRCLEDSEDPAELLVEAERVTEALNAGTKRKLNARTVAEVIADEGGINAFLRPESKPGIRIPFATIHETLGGLRRGKLILLGARPAVGKTAMASQIAEHAAAAGKTVLVVTLEMGARDVLHRAITGRAQVSAYRFRTGRMAECERNQVQKETSDLAALGQRLQLVDRSDTTLSAITALLRSMKARSNPADLVIIDYLQLLSSAGSAENRVQEVSALSRGLKRMAAAADIPVLALSQLSRKGAQTTDEPQLDWLKESGQLEQDADQVLFLWLKGEPKEGESTREVSWRMAKNRDGILNRGSLTFHTKFCRFDEQDDAAAGAAA